ncbi:HD-GYP domain-containing protein [Aporhodopirellula aestuarii]|uniref:HD-GYP domain-containing protein n=1 Tax=Aporhodopirellula aestuarii TaxID=2950107 RepID=A0ABT0U9R4_9BACT|nr:HD-GYP domain-containing protein [Aporhodopirellula aestuarii]MCM2373604.1 HD-GYP domain-containing protein [Aporhodopirellula aestuarii]
MSLSNVTVEELFAVNTAKEDLETLFGAPLSVCSYADICLCAGESTLGQSVPVVTDNPFGRFLPVDFDPQHPYVEELKSDFFRIAIPIHGSGRATLFAVGEMETTKCDWMSKLARLASDNLQLRAQTQEQELQLDSYAERVLQNFEERSWFEALANLELCDVTKSIEKIAARLLTHLQQILHCELVVFLSADEYLPFASEDSVDDLTQSFRTGVSDVNPELFTRIVEHFGSDAHIQPLVKNWISATSVKSKFPGVESVILVRVARQGLCHGWLIAINRSYENIPSQSGLGLVQEDFGTEEARLIQVAADVLITHIQSSELFRTNRELAIGAIRSLAGAVDAKDRYTHGHSDRVGKMAQQLGFRLGLGETTQEQLFITGLLHDVGKIGVPDTILNKPGRLGEDEYRELRRHPEIGFKILQPIEPLAYALEGVLQHHESVDGSGYPSRLAGDEISVAGRILAIVDAYDAMTSDRPYRKGMAFEAAEEILRCGAGSQWDIEMVRVFLEHAEDFREICREDKHVPAEVTSLSVDEGFLGNGQLNPTTTSSCPGLPS